MAVVTKAQLTDDKIFIRGDNWDDNGNVSPGALCRRIRKYFPHVAVVRHHDYEQLTYVSVIEHLSFDSPLLRFLVNLVVEGKDGDEGFWLERLRGKDYGWPTTKAQGSTP